MASDNIGRPVFEFSYSWEEHMVMSLPQHLEVVRSRHGLRSDVWTRYLNVADCQGAAQNVFALTCGRVNLFCPDFPLQITWRLPRDSHFASSDLYEPDTRQDTAIVGSSARELQQHPSDVEEVCIFFTEYKCSYSEIIQRLASDPVLADCQRRLDPLLATYQVRHDRKIFLEESYLAPTLEVLRSSGVEMHSAKGAPNKSVRVFLSDLNRGHVLASSRYQPLVWEALRGIPRSLQVTEKRRSHFHVTATTPRPEVGGTIDLVDDQSDVIDLDGNENSEGPDNAADPGNQHDESSCASTEVDVDEESEGGGMASVNNSSFEPRVLHGFIHLKLPTSQATDGKRTVSTTQMRKHALQPRSGVPRVKRPKCSPPDEQLPSQTVPQILSLEASTVPSTQSSNEQSLSGFEHLTLTEPISSVGESPEELHDGEEASV